MPEQRLHQTLAELDEELQGLESLDEPTRQLLADAMEEIASTLREKGAEHLEHQSLIERLEEVGGQFQREHPTLSGVVNRVIDILGQMGI